jgi:flagellar hook-associated protein FlgK
MSSIASIALSGLNAAQTKLNTTAHNVANLPTEGFRRQETVQTEQAGGGVATQVKRAPSPGNALESDVVNRLEAKHAYMANLAVFKTHNSMTGALLDNKA